LTKKGILLMGVALIATAALAGAWSIAGLVTEGNVEEAAYSVITKTGTYELRSYDPHLRAEVVMDGPYRKSLYGGFRVLEDYIFGNNTASTGISMTAPVVSEESETIAMTAPVLHQEQEEKERHLISFIMPAEYTLETLPKPNNASVTVREIAAQKMAALRFGGYAMKGRAERRIERLLKALAADGITVAGEAQVAQFNPPWTPPWMRRNEILIPIE